MTKFFSITLLSMFLISSSFGSEKMEPTPAPACSKAVAWERVQWAMVQGTLSFAIDAKKGLSLREVKDIAEAVEEARSERRKACAK